MNKREELRQLIQSDYINITGIVMIKNDAVAYEDYFDGYSDTDPIHIASITKSIISILVGIAIDKDHIKSIDEKVLSFFPDYTIKRGEKTIQQLTLSHLLTMTAPYKYKHEPYTKVYSSDDWTKAALDLLGGKGVVGTFKYSTVGIQILSGVLSYATGQSVLEFAAENLFIPLGIKVPHNTLIHNKEDYFSLLKDRHVSGWVVDSKGTHTAGWGLTLTAQDMAKIGQLYLKNGKWNGRQLVSPQWITDSTKAQSKWGELNYGYLWWVIEGANACEYAALGDGGNVIYISPKNKLVIVITSRFMPRAKDRIKLIREHLMPLL